mgnify:CR=1 FL=1
MKNEISINEKTNKLVNYLVQEEEKLGIEVSNGPFDCKIIDAGVKTKGSVEAGLIISEICLGGLGKTSLIPYNNIEISAYAVNVFAAEPVLSCLGSQYAGWSLSSGDFFSLGSGPVRSIAQKEEIFKELNYKDRPQNTVVVLEVDKFPPEEIVKKIATDCNLEPKKISFILTPTISLSGNIQVVSRVLEVAIHKIHELKFPLEKIIHGLGFAPLPPLAKDFITGMGRTNDAIIYGGVVQLMMNGSDSELEDLSKKLPSNSSKDYGKPFKEIFKNYEMDFYKIDGSLFSPAVTIINSIDTGRTFRGGSINEKLIKESFF